MKFSQRHFHPQSAFTMIEIAISLAIIGIALVGIIGVLPLGLNAQRDNRESTVINQDATVFMEDIRSGAKGADDLTNYVYAIKNYWTEYDNTGKILAGNNGVNNGYDYNSALVASGYFSMAGGLNLPINHGTNIIGLLTTPEFQDANGFPLPNLAGVAGYSNHIVAYVRSISGPAVEKPPQDNQILQQDSFSYHIFCVNAPVAVDTNTFDLPLSDPRRIYSDQLTANLHEVRLTFLWPVLPNGNLPVRPFHETFRTLVAGQVAQDAGDTNLYFYQPQSFTSAP